MTFPTPPLPGQPKGVVAVVETSTLVRAWRSAATGTPSASRRLVRLAGVAYDSFTSPAILEETAIVLQRPRFGATASEAQRWLDAFVRASRQVFAQLVPGGEVAIVGGDVDDLPVLKTAYAVFAAASEYPDVIDRAMNDGGLFLVSENSNHFVPGLNTHGFRFIRAHDFLELLNSRGQAAG